jgi:hypothetical protein
MVVMDVFTRRIIGFGVERADPWPPPCGRLRVQETNRSGPRLPWPFRCAGGRPREEVCVRHEATRVHHAVGRRGGGGLPLVAGAQPAAIGQRCCGIPLCDTPVGLDSFYLAAGSRIISAAGGPMRQTAVSVALDRQPIQHIEPLVIARHIFGHLASGTIEPTHCRPYHRRQLLPNRRAL